RLALADLDDDAREVVGGGGGVGEDLASAGIEHGPSGRGGGPAVGAGDFPGRGRLRGRRGGRAWRDRGGGGGAEGRGGEGVALVAHQNGMSSSTACRGWPPVATASKACWAAS